MLYPAETRLPPEVWDAINISPTNPVDSNKLCDWVHYNAFKDTVMNYSISHGVFFIFGIWEIWLARNALIFENISFDPSVVGKRAIFKVVEFFHLIGSNLDSPLLKEFFISWSPPPEGWLKLNVDGTCQGSPKLIAGGGLIRDSLGNWIHGFTKFFGQGNSILAELCAIYEGLNLAKSLHCEKLIVETDSLSAVNLISQNVCGNLHYLSTLIHNCKATLSAFSEVELCHIHREGNACADLWAKKALMENRPLLYFDSMPSFLSSCFMADISCTIFSRFVRVNRPP
ncbi:reverse transcriptase [Senna tora]|uniref:Reverse transcriptase n=1 Tax=Senna tora TaxID=362788 RepID=A0A834TGR3_9FABA|nr:reverse transcriptase [Senna tora]